jgi:hypothetical protein
MTTRLVDGCGKPMFSKGLTRVRERRRRTAHEMQATRLEHATPLPSRELRGSEALCFPWLGVRDGIRPWLLTAA